MTVWVHNSCNESLICCLIYKQNEVSKFFIFHFSISKQKFKNERIFRNLFFDFKSEKWIRKFWFLSFEIGFKSKQIQKKFFLRFSSFNSITKFEKWKIFFEIRFFISNQKINFKILKFVFRVLIWNGSH